MWARLRTEVKTHTGISDDLLSDKSSPRDFYTCTHTRTQSSPLLLGRGIMGCHLAGRVSPDPGSWEYRGGDLSGYTEVTEVSRTKQCIYTSCALSGAVRGEVIFHHLSAGFSHARSKSLHGLAIYSFPPLPRILCDVLLRWKESGAHHYKSAC